MTTAPDARDQIAEVTALVATHFPEVQVGGEIAIEQISETGCRLRLKADPSHLRPGETISGPTMFKLADLSVWVMLLGIHGERALQAVTTSLTINFLNRPQAADLIGEAHLLKLGRRLAVADVRITSALDSRLVAHATATYAIPPETPGA
ncbi:MAG: PaaI family thioesterase [Pseudomonadota bacterium]